MQRESPVHFLEAGSQEVQPALLFCEQWSNGAMHSDWTQRTMILSSDFFFFFWASECWKGVCSFVSGFNAV